MRLILLAFVALLLTGGVRVATPPATHTGHTWYYMGDTHFGAVVGDGVLGRNRLRKIVTEINADTEARFLIVGGDMEYDHTTTEMQDSLTVLLTQTLNVPVFPVIGNHDETLNDTSPNLFDHMVNRYPGMFASWQSNTNRGRRWFHQYRPAGVPVSIFGLQTNRNNADDNYLTENPATGYEVSADDFDGISDSTSTQRRDLKTAMAGLGYYDWPIVGSHRTAHGIIPLSIGRPDIEGINSGDADSSFVEWMDTRLDGRNWILLEADAHENKAFTLINNHYTFSACMSVRGYDFTRYTTWSSYVHSLAMGDTSYSATTAGALDSLGVDGSDQDYGLQQGWNILWKFKHTGPGTMTAYMLLIQNFDATAVIDSMSLSLR